MAANDAHDAIPFEDVRKGELEQIMLSRKERLSEAKPEEQPDSQLVGLALSGGGVRSAIFSLGVLQTLARFGLFRRIDYLSCTGGGAQIAGWLLRWIRARGFREVDSHLSGKGSSTIEAPEIQALRRSIAFPQRRSISIVALAVLRNIAMNLLALATLLAASILFTRIALEEISRLVFESRYNFGPRFVLVAAAVSAILIILLNFKSSPACPPTQLRTVLVALVLILFSAALLTTGIVKSWYFATLTSWSIYGGLAVTSFCLILGFSRPFSVKNVSTHLGAAIVAGIIASLLLISIVPMDFSIREFFLEEETNWMQVALSVIIVIEAASLLFYAVILKKWLPRATREWFWRVCRTLLGFASVLLIVSNAWLVPVWLAGSGIGVHILLTALGLFKGLGHQPKWRVSKYFFNAVERVAPYTFAVAITVVVALLLENFVLPYTSSARVVEIGLAIGMVLISLLVLWLIKAREFTMHGVQRSAIVRNYLAPATSSADATFDIDLSDSFANGPYPLIGAALDVAEIDPSPQMRTVPFLLSPLLSGFELPHITDRRPRLSEAYRPTNELAGGISLASAIAVSEPIRGKSFRPPSGAASMLWTIFNMRDGRFIGNPIQNENWRARGPLIEPLFALREGDLPNEAPFVRPFPSEDFDYLGIYQLVKRRCRFILACDATDDPSFAFEDLGRTIHRCRTELGVEIQMDLGPLWRTTGTTSGAHYQIAQIRYGAGDEGLMVYIKPSLTGDEPAGLIQYARSHPEFPAADASDRRFEEYAFESYRALGQHIVETLFAELKINPHMSTAEVLGLIRRKLQPEFKESEPTPEPEEGEATVPIPEELINAIASGQCVLCTGSGLAAQARLPTWPAFLDSLLRTARELGVLDENIANGLTSTLAAGEYEAAADDLTHQIPREVMIEHMRSVNRDALPSKAHKLLTEMKFLGALNISIDDLLANAFHVPVVVPSQADRLVGALQSKNFFVANLFGSASQPSSLLFTMKEFRQLLHGDSQLKQFLGTLFLRYTMIFIGLSLDGIRSFIEAVELPQAPERKHFAIVPDASTLDPVKVRFFARSYNVRIISYQPGFNYAGLPAFLDQLQSKVRETAMPSKASAPLTLKSVNLENIGPFHSVQVDFTSQWNVLLGDNGVGKTVLLRAIAAALCGEEADQASVARLLRVGAAKGSIRLKDENREYTVELERKLDGTVQVVSASLSPIIYERWLVLGFPALRSIPLTRPKGPKPLRLEAPSAEDLLPLLRGEPDDRIADLKQWLVNLDYVINKEEASSARIKRLRDDFFRVLQILTPGLRFEPGTINSKTMEITVVTDSGTVPLELVSQGTGAVMCWIGTLLERLSETGKSRDAIGKSALILIDELDAHMHPKWQRLFVDAFRKAFESVQIIATTHSPLLVGSLRAEELWSIHRAPLKSEIDGVFVSENVVEGTREIVILGSEEDGEKGQPPKRQVRRYFLPQKVDLLVKKGDTVEEEEPLTKENVRVVAERVNMSAEGWRADQILTSPLFSLDTTRDPETARLLSRYTELTALEAPSKADSADLAKVSQELQIRMPNAHETEAARKAFDLIRDFANKSLDKLDDEDREAVLTEVKVQLTESITGSGRNE